MLGKGRKGVLLVSSTLSQKEREKSDLFVGDSGLALERMLNKANLTKDDFYYSTVVPGPLELPDSGLPKVVVALGTQALDRLLGISHSSLEHRTQGRRGYVEWSEYYKCWVIGTYEPDWLNRGNWAKTGVFLGDIQRAVQIAREGFEHRPPRTIEDPTPAEFEQWIRSLPEGGPVAFDIETPGKAKAAEDELDFEDATPIERVSLAARPGEGVSVPWDTAYIPLLKSVFDSSRRFLVWNRSFDKPRLESNSVRFGGPVEDVMYAWHVLQPDLPMAINYVGSIFLPHYKRWKHEHYGRPAYYSAVDSAALWDLADSIYRGLSDTGQLEYYYRFIHEVTDALEEMTKPGIPIDWGARVSLSKQLKTEQDNAFKDIQSVIPENLFRFNPPQGYVRSPQDTTGLAEISVTAPVKVCSKCGLISVTKGAHTGKKSYPCYDAPIVVEPRPLTRWAEKLPFTPSNKQLLDYQEYRGHKSILSEPKEDGSQSPTFDSQAVLKLTKIYEFDPLYPILARYKEPEKLLGFVGKVTESGELSGGWPNKGGRLYPIFGHKPATGRCNCKQPNLQQIPRVDKDDPRTTLLRSIFKPEPGTAIVEIDYSAIEAVLVGWFAGDRYFTRLAKLGVHDYLNSHILRMRGLIGESADVSWSDADLTGLFGDLKGRFKKERQMAKTVVYLSLFGGSPKRIYESEPGVFSSVKQCQEIQGLLFDLFPKVLEWQNQVVELAAKQGYLTGIWGQSRRFYRVWEWSKTRDGHWTKRFGKQSKEAMNFVIQHAASGILKNAVLICREERPDIFQYLRLLIHDSVFGYLPLTFLVEMGSALEAIMRRPIQLMPLDPSWNMGSNLIIGTESKVCYESWAKEEKVPWS